MAVLDLVLLVVLSVQTRVLGVMDPTLAVKHKSVERVHATYESTHHASQGGRSIHLELMSTPSNYSIDANDGGPTFRISSKRFAIGKFPTLSANMLGHRFLLVDMPGGSKDEAFKGKPSPLFFHLQGATRLPDEKTLTVWVKLQTEAAHNSAAQLLIGTLHGAWKERAPVFRTLSDMSATLGHRHSINGDSFTHMQHVYFLGMHAGKSIDYTPDLAKLNLGVKPLKQNAKMKQLVGASFISDDSRQHTQTRRLRWGFPSSTSSSSSSSSGRSTCPNDSGSSCGNSCTCPSSANKKSVRSNRGTCYTCDYNRHSSTTTTASLSSATTCNSRICSINGHHLGCKGSECLGMCGAGCSCWKWVCGTCCVVQQCYDHDVCCNQNQPLGFSFSSPKCWNIVLTVFGHSRKNFPCNSRYECTDILSYVSSS